jgi:aspartate kinase
MTMALESLGVFAVSLTGWQAGIQTDHIHGNARITGLGNDRIRRELAAGKVVVVAGFQGVDAENDITTLGRGGSDTTAVALAAFLQAGRCQIFTDVDGVYDRDPRIFPDAEKYDRIGCDEMLALARQGAQVLHDRCVELAKEYAVPVQVLSSFRPGPGTLVTDIPESLLPDLIKDIPPG